MLKQKNKIIEIDGVKYRLGKLDARSASYMAMKTAAVLAPALGSGNGMDVQAAASALPKMSRAEFDEIQTMLLKTVCKLEVAGNTDMPVPVLKSDGSFVDVDMAYDAMTVIRLTAEALMFNIGGFFQGAGLSQTMK